MINNVSSEEPLSAVSVVGEKKQNESFLRGSSKLKMSSNEWLGCVKSKSNCNVSSLAVGFDGLSNEISSFKIWVKLLIGDGGDAFWKRK